MSAIPRNVGRFMTFMYAFYDVSCCAKLKSIFSCLNFGFEVNLSESECLMTDMKEKENNKI